MEYVTRQVIYLRLCMNIFLKILLIVLFAALGLIGVLHWLTPPLLTDGGDDYLYAFEEDGTAGPRWKSIVADESIQLGINKPDQRRNAQSIVTLRVRVKSHGCFRELNTSHLEKDKLVELNVRGRNISIKAIEISVNWIKFEISEPQKPVGTLAPEWYPIITSVLIALLGIITVSRRPWFIPSVPKNK